MPSTRRAVLAAPRGSQRTTPRGARPGYVRERWHPHSFDCQGRTTARRLFPHGRAVASAYVRRASRLRRRRQSRTALSRGPSGFLCPSQPSRRASHRSDVLVGLFHHRPASSADQQVLFECRRVGLGQIVHSVLLGGFAGGSGAVIGAQRHDHMLIGRGVYFKVESHWHAGTPVAQADGTQGNSGTSEKPRPISGSNHGQQRPPNP